MFNICSCVAHVYDFPLPPSVEEHASEEASCCRNLAPDLDDVGDAESRSSEGEGDENDDNDDDEEEDFAAAIGKLPNVKLDVD